MREKNKKKEDARVIKRRFDAKYPTEHAFSIVSYMKEMQWGKKFLKMQNNYQQKNSSKKLMSPFK